MDVIRTIEQLSAVAGLADILYKMARRHSSLNLLVTFGWKDSLIPCGYRHVRAGLKRLQYAQHIDNLKLAEAGPKADQGEWYYVSFSPYLLNLAPVPVTNCTVTVTVGKRETCKFAPTLNTGTLHLSPRQLRWFHAGPIQPGKDLFIQLDRQQGEAQPIRLLLLRNSGPQLVLGMEVTAFYGQEKIRVWRIQAKIIIEPDWVDKWAWILIPVGYLGKANLPVREPRLNRYYLVELPREDKEKWSVLHQLERLGPPKDAHAMPHEVIHYRLSPDGSKAIVQGCYSLRDLEVLRNFGARYLGAYLPNGMAEDSVYQELQRPEWNVPEDMG